MLFLRTGRAIKRKSCNITIYGRPSISIDISETGYVGIGNKVITEVSGGDWDKIQWYISKNGAAKKNYLNMLTVR